MHEIDNDLLRDLYLVEEMSMRKIAVQLGLPKNSIKKLLVNYAIPIRTRVEQFNTAKHKAHQQKIAQEVSANPQERKRRSQRLKKKWAEDTKWREDILIKRKDTWDNDSTLRQGASDRMKIRWQDPNYVADQAIASEKSWQDPEIRARRTNGIIAANQRPEVVGRKRAGTQRAWQSLSYRLTIEKAVSDYWEDPENHKRHSLIMREVAKRDGYREAISNGLREYWVKPGKKEQRALVSAMIWQRPGMREQIRQSLIKNWDERLRIKSILWGFDKKLPALSKEEEAKFFAMVIRGDSKARYKFFCSNMGLAEKLAWRIWQNIGQIFPDYEEMDIDFEVVEQEAYLALGRAIQDYNPTRGSFSTLAYISVPQDVIKALHDIGRLVRVPHNAVKIFDGNVLRNPFYVDSIRPNDDEDNFFDGFSIFQTEESQNEPYLRRENGADFFDTTIEDAIRLIKKKIPHLSKRDEDVLKLRIDGLTLEEIGLITRLSRERIRQIIAKIATQASVVIKELV